MGAHQGDIRRNLGFSRDTLRLYEKRGIITPAIDPENGYRSYDDWQVNLLWEAKMYQGIGFSLDEVATIEQKDSLKDLEEDLAGCIEAKEHDIRMEELHLAAARHEMQEVRAIAQWREGKHPAFWIEENPSRRFIAERRDHELLEGASPEALSYVMRCWGCLAATFWFPDLSDGSYFWGFTQESEIFEELGGPKAGRFLFTLPQGRCLASFVDAGDRGGFGLELFCGLVEEARRRGLAVEGSIGGELICRTHEEDGYHRFIHAWLPLEEEA